MILQVEGFDWDRGNRAKCQKHGLSVALIEGLFGRPLAIIPSAVGSEEEAAFALWDGLVMAGEYFLCSRCGAKAISN
jgi:uncharacterized DUF497 family protein